jgi:hypothetical protein
MPGAIQRHIGIRYAIKLPERRGIRGEGENGKLKKEQEFFHRFWKRIFVFEADSGGGSDGEVLGFHKIRNFCVAGLGLVFLGPRSANLGRFSKFVMSAKSHTRRWEKSTRDSFLPSVPLLVLRTWGN